VRILALDHGPARTGVAVSDPTGTVVRPLATIAKVDTPDGARRLDALIAEHAPELVLVGEPRLMSGERGAQARSAAGFARRLRARLDVPVELVDERLSTREAARRRDEARPAGGRARAGGAELDSLAACVLLEAYLARRP
jgi:putative Holliday junction resolvase